MGTNPILYVVAKDRKYNEVKVFFSEGKIVEIPDKLSFPKMFIFFGFPEDILKEMPGLEDHTKSEKEEKRIRLETFKTLIEAIYEKAKEFNVDHVLLNIVENESHGNTWVVRARYQFMIAR